MVLAIEGLGFRYGRTAALEDVSASVEHGACLAVLGPSGSGKSTLLNLVAGLLRPTAGRIALGGRTLSLPSWHAAPEVRNVGMVFQDFALWPHMTVAGNIAFPLRVRRTRRRAIEARLEELLDLLHLGGLQSRYPHELSGGQRQRVAVARALAPEPPLLLLDEPMSNLDAQLREEMRVELAQVLRRSGTTALYVTHDRIEAMTMADRILLLERGRTAQLGAPEELYERPANLFVARFMGPCNVLPGTAGRQEDGAPGRAEFATGIAGLILTGTLLAPAARAGAAVFRPDRVTVAPEGSAASPNRLRGRVVHSAYLGQTWHHTVEIGPGSAVAVSLPSRLAGNVCLHVPPEAVLLVAVG